MSNEDSRPLPRCATLLRYRNFTHSGKLHFHFIAMKSIMQIDHNQLANCILANRAHLNAN